MTDFGRVVQDAFHKQRLDQARGLHQLMKDQMMTGDVPTSTDGPASEKKKKKKKGPGDCGPDGAHVAKGGRIEVGGYMRRTKSGKLIHVKGYTRDQIAGFSDEMLESKARDQKNWTATRVSPADAEKYGLKSIPHKNLAARRAERAKNRPPFTGDKPPNLKPTRAVNARGDKSTPKFKIENVDQKKGPTDEQKKRHAEAMGTRSAESPASPKPKSGGKFTQVKPGEEKEVDGVTVRRSKAIGGRGSTYTLRTPAIGQVAYGMKQSAAKREHEYLVAHDGGKKKDPTYKWQTGYDIGDRLEDGSTVTAFWRNELIVKRPDGSTGRHSVLAKLPTKVAKTKVEGYTRVVNGKVVHVSGYVTGGHAAIDAMSPDDILRRANNPRNKTFNLVQRANAPHVAQPRDRVPFKIENVDPKTGPTLEQTARHAAEMGVTPEVKPFDVDKVTAAKVGSVLSRGGHSRTSSHATAVRGWRNHTSGFQVVPVGGGDIGIGHVIGNIMARDKQVEITKKRIAAYSDTLTKAGIQHEVTGDGQSIIVKGGKKHHDAIIKQLRGAKQAHESSLKRLQGLRATMNKFEYGNPQRKWYEREIQKEHIRSLNLSLKIPDLEKIQPAA